MECPHLKLSALISQSSNKNNKCSVCHSDKSPWMCLHCGIVNCSRYINGHAQAHFEAESPPLHAVCLDCDSLAAFCYVCDDFVVNDTTERHLERLRRSLEAARVSEEHEVDPKRKRSDSCSSSGAENDTGKRKCSRAALERSRRIAGLRNLGNTCFMNAVLQSLSNIQEFCGYFTQLPELGSGTTLPNGLRRRRSNHAATPCHADDTLVAEELRKTLVALRQAGKTAISPESLFSVIWKVVPRFRGYQQQDAHEFLRYMLDRLHTELLQLLFPARQRGEQKRSVSRFGAKSSASTIVTAVFGGILQNEVNCLVCRTESKKHDPFLDLSLDIPSHFATHNGAKDEAVPVCGLLDCLDSFTELEELAETELYYCSACKCKQRSTKKFWIRRLPNVLCLHLKRFRWSSSFRSKIDHYVEFPVRGLDMSKFLLENMHETRGSCTGSSLYDLAAVVVHHGSGAGSGHYTAYATREGHWHHFNDSTVTRAEESTVARCKAYIFFYIRREFKVT